MDGLRQNIDVAVGYSLLCSIGRLPVTSYCEHVRIAVIEDPFVNDDSLSSAVGSQADGASDIRLKIFLARFNI